MVCLSVFSKRFNSQHFKALEAYHIKSLQKILGLHWWQKVTHAEIRERTSAHCMEHLVMQRQLRWVGHVIRMQSNRLPLRALYSELQQGKRATGGQKKRFSDHAKTTLRKCSVPPDELEALAADREAWRDVCEEGLAAFDINYDQETEARRARRHTVTSAPASGPRCHICGRICASEFALRSHLRCHRPSLTSWHSVIVVRDGHQQASKRLSVVCHIRAHCMLKPFDGFKCHLAATLVESNDTLSSMLDP